MWPSSWSNSQQSSWNLTTISTISRPVTLWLFAVPRFLSLSLANSHKEMMMKFNVRIDLHHQSPPRLYPTNLPAFNAGIISHNSPQVMRWRRGEGEPWRKRINSKPQNKSSSFVLATELASGYNGWDGTGGVGVCLMTTRTWNIRYY